MIVITSDHRPRLNHKRDCAIEELVPTTWATSLFTLRSLFLAEQPQHRELSVLLVAIEDRDHLQHALTGPPLGQWRGYHPILDQQEAVVGSQRYRFYVWGPQQDYGPIERLLKQAADCLTAIPPHELLEAVGEFPVELGWLGLLEHLAWSRRGGALLTTQHAVWQEDRRIPLDEHNQEILLTTGGGRLVSYDDSPSPCFYSEWETDLICASVAAIDLLLAASGMLTAATTPAAQPEYVFRRDGDMWQIRYGNEHGSFCDTKGLKIIHRLLESPQPPRAIPAIGLANINRAVEDIAPLPETFSREEVLDDEAINGYETRLHEIAAEIDEANERYDDTTVERLELERQSIGNELMCCLNNRSESRPLGSGAPAEKASNAVSQALSRAYRQLRAADKPLLQLANHLEASILPEKLAWAYRPDPSIDWKLHC